MKALITIFLVLIPILTSCGDKKEAKTTHTHEVVEDFAIVQGDIILGDASTLKNNSRTIASVEQGTKLWPAGVVPFEVEGGGELGPRVRAAIDHFHQSTHIRFRPRQNEANYLIIREGLGRCASYVGMQGGGQVLFIDESCETGMIIHELGHVIGLFHEQNRTDRNAHVRIAWENVIPGMEFNFLKDADSKFEQFVKRKDFGEYDLSSVMQSEVTAFSRNGRPTIVPLNGAPSIGQRRSLSFNDILGIAKLYKDAPTRLVHRVKSQRTGPYKITGTATLPDNFEPYTSVRLWVSGTGTCCIGERVFSTASNTIEFEISNLPSGNYVVGVTVDQTGNTYGEDSGDILGFFAGSEQNAILDPKNSQIIKVERASVHEIHIPLAFK